MHRILIVEDNDAVREALRDALVCEGYRVDAAATGAQATKLARRSTPGVVLLDIRMPDLPDGEGDALTGWIAESGCGAVPIIVLSGDSAAADQARRIKAAGFMPEPFDLTRLVRLIEDIAGRPTAIAS